MATVTVGSDPGDDFTSLQAAINSFTNPFTEPNVIQVRGEVFSLGTTTIELNVTTTATNNLTIEAIAGQEQDWIQGNGPVFTSTRTGGFGVFTLRNNCDHVSIFGVQIESNATSTLHCFLDFRTSIAADSSINVEDCYWYHSASQAGSPAIWRRQSNNITNRNVNFTNCLFNTMNEGIQGDSGQNGNVTCTNVTLVRRLVDVDNANLGIRYAIVTDCYVHGFGPTSGFRDYLNLNGSSTFYAASDTTGSAASLDNLALLDQYTDPANDDWSLKAGNALAGAGSGGNDIGVIVATGPAPITVTGDITAPSPVVSGTATISEIRTVTGAINAPSPSLAGTATVFDSDWLFLTLGVVDPDKTTRVDFNQPFNIAQNGRIAYDPTGGTVSIATDGRLTVTDPGATFQWAYDDGTGWSNFITSTVTFGEGDLIAPSPIVAGTVNVLIDITGSITAPAPVVSGNANVSNNITTNGNIVAPSPVVSGNADVIIPAGAIVTAPSPVVAGVVTVRIEANGNIVAPSPLVSGNVDVQGFIGVAGNIVAPSPVVAGVVNVQAQIDVTSDITAPSPVVSGNANVLIEASGNIVAPSPVVNAFVTVGDSIAVAGNIVAPSPIVAGIASVVIEASANIVAPSPTLSGNAVVDAPIIANGDLIAPTPVVDGLATVTITCTAAIVAPSPIVVGFQASPITTPDIRRAAVPASNRRATVLD